MSAGATLRCSAQPSHCGGFSCCRARALEHRLSSCGARAQLLRGMWNIPGPGLEPVSPALAGGFLTTVPAGKPQFFFFNIFIGLCNHCCSLIIECFPLPLKETPHSLTVSPLYLPLQPYETINLTTNP